MSTIVLIRPGCTDFDDQQRIQGALDIPLNECGLRQAQQIANDLHHIPLDLIYSGPQAAARETAALLGRDRGLTPKVVEDLHNVDCGLWQGLRVEDLRRKHHKVFKLCQDSPDSVCPPEGETLSEAAQRVQQALAKPLRKGLNFAIVAPEPVASVIRCIIQHLAMDHVCWLPATTAGEWECLQTAEPVIESPSSLFRRFVWAPAADTHQAAAGQTAVIVSGERQSNPAVHADARIRDEAHEYGREPDQRLVTEHRS